jgi:hypothetical protein
VKKNKYTILYCVFVRTFVIPFYYSSRTVISYGSSSDFLTSYRTVPVPNGKKLWFLRFRFHNTGDSKNRVTVRTGQQLKQGNKSRVTARAGRQQEEINSKSRVTRAG